MATLRHAGFGELKVDYEILEDACESPFGGRLYTHRFSKDGTHDYYDVVAMCFPDNDVMNRTFRLFDFLDIKKGKFGERTSPTDWPVLVPYYLRDDKDVCPSYFKRNRKGLADPSETSKRRPKPNIPEGYLRLP
ncbi:hypothetical protein LZ30DRAFT_693839 [Colletotrichum cereale]|nr:hypothetical protein LZ30DRAFT_693839 [Colletotrichum cereale]